METSQFGRPTTDAEAGAFETQVAGLAHTGHAASSIDHVGAEVAAVLRSFAEIVEVAKRDVEQRAGQTLAEAHATASGIRQAAEEEAHRLRVAAQDAHDQGLKGLDVARAEARHMWEEARASADAMLNEARAEADALLDQARAAATATQANAEIRAARLLSESQAAADDQAQRATSRVDSIFDSAREDLRRLHEARIDALRALEVSEERMREISQRLQSLGDLDAELLTVEAAAAPPDAQVFDAPISSELPPPPPAPWAMD